MELNFVYALIDPRLVGVFTVDPRFIDPAGVLYIGVTTNPNERYQAHMSSSSNIEKSERIEQLLAAGVEPGMVIFEVVYDDRSRAYSTETDWIQYYLLQGAQLSNSRKAKRRSGSDPISEQLESPLFTTVTPVSTRDTTFQLAYVLEMLVHGIEETGKFHTLVASWLQKNNLVYWLAGCMTEQHSASNAWASLTILPVLQNRIPSLLSGEIGMYDIPAEDILIYEPGHTYTCYIASAICQPGKEGELSQLFQHALARLSSLGIYITRIYASTANSENTALLSFVVRHSFTQLASSGPSVWGLCPDAWSFSSSIREYQKRVRQAIARPLIDEYSALFVKRSWTQQESERLGEIEQILYHSCGLERVQAEGNKWEVIAHEERLRLPKPNLVEDFQVSGEPD